MKTLTITSVTIVGSAVAISGTVADSTPAGNVQQTTVAEYPSGNPRWSRAHRLTDQALMVIRNGATYNTAIPLTEIAKIAIAFDPTTTWAPYISVQPATTVTTAGNVAASGVLTGVTASNVSDGDTVTIGSKVYTFKTTLGTTEGQVHIGASASYSVQNLYNAINHAGTPGTDYYCEAANVQVVASGYSTSGNPHFTVTASTAGLFGNAIATTETSSNLSWGNTTLTGGTVTSATLPITVNTELTMTYQWQFSSDGSTSWTNVSTGYTGGTTATLTIAPTTTSQNGYYLRCVITDSISRVTTSQSSVLTIA